MDSGSNGRAKPAPRRSGGIVLSAMVATIALLVGLLMQARNVVETELGPVPPGMPRALQAGVEFGDVRFLFLNEWSVRVERSPERSFEDRDTMIFSSRRAFLRKYPGPFVAVRTDKNNTVLVLSTSELEVRYGSEDEPHLTYPALSASTLSITPIGSDKPAATWKPGDRDDLNLRGTIRTLDHINGSTPLEPGLVSRSGWTVIDDTKSAVFEDSTPDGEIPWVSDRTREEGYSDTYFFAYGLDMRKMLGTYVELAGRVPLPPRFSMGYWWSRWWPYSDEELKELVKEFRDHDVPLDVLVVDMDWHLVAYEMMNMGYRDLAKQPLGWTGYTWNETLFPDPDAFLDWCHEKDLRVTLNLHPAGGIQPWENAFPAMAKEMGISPDPKDRQHVPFDVASRKFVRAWFDFVLRPLEKQGIDFWWLDWQQHNYTTIPNLNPTIWLNHVFFNDMQIRRQRAIRKARAIRGLIFHRWGGLGSHRYQVGFSGDVTTSWESLRFQIYFTLTAANVAFGHWSHDIGGFLGMKATPPELFARWVQWGAVSAVFRTHAWRKKYLERRLWMYDNLHFRVMREAVRLRFSIALYLYTLNRHFYDTGIAPIYPVYYDYPRLEEAYAYKTQFFLGPRVLVSPITKSATIDEIINKEVFLSEGKWVEWHNGRYLSGPGKIESPAALEDLPMFIRTGTVLPMSFPRETIDKTTIGAPLVLAFFPGKDLDDGTMTLYEDDGVTTEYTKSGGTSKHGHATTDITASCSKVESSCTVQIRRLEGSYAGMPKSRWYFYRALFVPPPARVLVNKNPAVRVDDFEYEDGAADDDFNLEWSMRRAVPKPLGNSTGLWRYDPVRFTVEVLAPNRDVRMPSSVSLHWDDKKGDTLRVGLMFCHNGIYGILRHIHRVISTLKQSFDRCDEVIPEVVAAGKESSGAEWLSRMEEVLKDAWNCKRKLPKIRKNNV